MRGPWAADEIDGFLDGARWPLRLSVNGGEGWPLLASLWFVWTDGMLWCATQRSSRIARLVERDGRCAFEISPNDPPYRGVRGQGNAVLDETLGPAILERLIDRYVDAREGSFAGWLRSRAKGETAICIRPTSLMSWDFESRMREKGASR